MSTDVVASERVARTSLAVLRDLFDDGRPRDFAVRLWDGTGLEPDPGEAARFTLVFRRPRALRVFLGGADELTLSEAYIHADLDVEGNLEAVFPVADRLLVERRIGTRDAVRQTARLLSLPRNRDASRNGTGRARLSGKRSSLRRDRDAVSYHYDRPNDFFARWLDRRMLYTTAYFTSPTDSLEEAQERKLDHVCRKLQLRPGERLLDIGCGWGGLAVFAAERYGAETVGVTLSEHQAQWARADAGRRGVGDRCRILVCDYRELDEGDFDKGAALGMFEHVPQRLAPEYFRRVARLLRPGGLYLNHAIARSLTRPERRGRSFVDSYVFPDAELEPISATARAADLAGLEVRDVESLRDHYPRTLREWLRRLEASREAAVRVTDEATYRVFRLYLAGSVHGFVTGRLNVYQTLLARPDRGRVQLPLQRGDLYV
jgi:cyclopropane-fatty-acyl-phospholipid synthase